MVHFLTVYNRASILFNMSRSAVIRIFFPVKKWYTFIPLPQDPAFIAFREQPEQRYRGVFKYLTPKLELRRHSIAQPGLGSTSTRYSYNKYAYSL